MLASWNQRQEKAGRFGGLQACGGHLRGYTWPVTQDFSTIDTEIELRAHGAGESTSVGVYALIAGLTAAIPLPFVDEFLSSAARGAAMRRVAARHNVKLVGDARKILSQPTLRVTGGGRRARWVRSAVLRVLAPLRIASRLEDGATAMVAASLFEHHLKSADRGENPTLDVREAQAIHQAIEKATMGSVWDLGKAVPAALVSAVTDGVKALREDDDEDRGTAERAFDAVLDGLADAPEAWKSALVARFEKAMSSGR